MGPIENFSDFGKLVIANMVTSLPGVNERFLASPRNSATIRLPATADRSAPTLGNTHS